MSNGKKKWVVAVRLETHLGLQDLTKILEEAGIEIVDTSGSGERPQAIVLATEQQIGQLLAQHGDILVTSRSQA